MCRAPRRSSRVRTYHLVAISGIVLTANFARAQSDPGVPPPSPVAENRPATDEVTRLASDRWFLSDRLRSAGFTLEHRRDDDGSSDAMVLSRAAARLGLSFESLVHRVSQDWVAFRPRDVEFFGVRLPQKTGGGLPPRVLMGGVRQTVSAAPFRGRCIEAQAMVRMTGPANHAYMWVLVDQPEGTPGSYVVATGVETSDHTAAYRLGWAARVGVEALKQPRKAALGNWQLLDLVIPVGDRADSIRIGFVTSGRAPLRIGETRIGTYPLLGGSEEAPRPITDSGLANVEAFCRLYGYIRYFHPSDAVRSADWTRVASRGVRAVEGAPDSRALADSLRAVFSPLAPTVIVQAESEGQAADSSRPSIPVPRAGWKIARWHYEGPGDFGGPPYSRELRERPAHVDGKAVLPEVFKAQLGAGVYCEVPLDVYRAGEVSQPVSSGTGTDVAVRTDPVTAADRAVRLATVIIGWNALQHFAPTFPNPRTPWREALREALRAAAEDEDPETFLQTLRRMMASTSIALGGVSHGVEAAGHQPPFLWEWLDEDLVVTRVGPGVRIGLAPGDVIRELNGQPVRQIMAERARATVAASEQERRYRTAAGLLAGGPKDTLRLLIDDGATASGRVVRVARELRGDESYAIWPDSLGDLGDGILYIRHDAMTEHAMVEATGRIARAKGVVVDLRSTSRTGEGLQELVGMMIQDTVRSPEWRTPVIERPDFEDVDWESSSWVARPSTIRISAPVAFLIDGSVSGYRETWLAIVRHYRLADLVGSPTAGSNGNTVTLRLPSGFSMRFAGMLARNQDGSDFHGTGVLPTVPVRPSIMGLRAGRDEVLQKAIEVLRARIAAP